MPFISVNNVKTHYIERSADDQELTVLVHGLGDNLSVWYLTLSTEQLRGRHVLMYDLRAHGRSDHVHAGFSLTQLADDLAVLIERFAAGRAVNLVGNSLGSAIALKYACEHHTRLSRLVLIEPTLPPFDQMIDEEEISPEELAKRAPPGSRQVFLKHPFVMTRVLAKYVAVKQTTSVITELLDEPPMQASALAGIRVPTLLITATDSSWGKSAELVRSTLPSVQHREYQASHFIMLEARKQVADAVADFLSPSGAR